MRRSLAWLLGLAVLACEVSTPPSPSGRSPSTNPSASKSTPTTPGTESKAAAPDPIAEPGPPPPPPFDEAGGLSYREIVLRSEDPEAQLPMVVAIHGLGDSPDNFKHLLDHFPEPARVILPRGLDPVEAGGFSWFPIRARDPDVEALSAGISRAADRIAEGLAVLQRSRPTVGKPIVTGFSQGGMLTFTLAVHHPEVVGTAVAVGGWLPPPLVPEALTPDVQYPPIFALHGTTDAAVRYEPTVAAIESLQKHGLKVELTSYEGVGHAIPPPMRRDLHDRLIDAVRAEHKRPTP